MSWRQGLMKTTPADKKFSLWVRWKSGWKCETGCGWYGDPEKGEDRAYLHNSHFFPRGVMSMRFDPRNCIAACRKCHDGLKGPTDPRYQEIMRKRLGDEYDTFWLQGHSNGKRPDEFLMNALWAAELRKIGVNPSTGRKFGQALSSFDPGEAA